MNRLHLFAAVGAMLSASTAQAQPAPAAAASPPVCHDSPRFLVIGQDDPDEVGTAFIVKTKPSPDAKLPCAFAAAPADLRAGGHGYAFLALAGRHLALTVSTGPGGTLEIIDLETRRSVLSVAYTEAGDPSVENGTIVFSAFVGPATARNCKTLASFKKDGGTGQIGVRTTFDLATGAVSKARGQACTYAQ